MSQSKSPRRCLVILSHATAQLAIAASLTCSGCAQGSRVSTGERKYAPVSREQVQVLFQPPSRPYKEIGVAMAQGAQLATDATAIEEVRSQATKLGADAVIISGMDRRAYFHSPGFVNVQTQSNVSGNVNPYGQFNAYGNSQTTGIVTPPQTFSGTHVTGIAIKFTSRRSDESSSEQPATVTRENAEPSGAHN